MTSALTELSVSTLSAGLAARRFSPVDVVEAHLARIASLDPRLHAFASVENPDRPLVLPEAAWQALARHAGPVQVADFPCGDQASETDREIRLKAERGRISARSITYACHGLTADKAAKPITDEPY